MTPEIIFENEKFRLKIDDKCRAESLILKSSAEEFIFPECEIPLFSIVEERPYHNEIKLSHPAVKTTFGANRVRQEGENLIVGFEHLNFEAVVNVTVKERYMVFTLVDFIVNKDSFGVGVLPMMPPVYEFRLCQLPVAHREHFGEWLNVLWDDRAAVNVLAASPYALISSEHKKDHRVLYGGAQRDVKLKNVGVALIVSKTDELLDAIDVLEKDFGLPHGVEGRRSALLNRSYYRPAYINPKNADRYIEYAQKGGFKFMAVYYRSIFEEGELFSKTGDYSAYRKEYPNGKKDVADMLAKIKAAGITPGLHILHTHIGLGTKYNTPRADHRINLVKRLTLSQPISESDTTIYVEESPEGAPVFEKMRVLRFMGELISYESYTDERPYKFIGCKRGFNGTVAKAHEIGTPGGVLDISEFCGNSAYIDQRTSLQDEIADEIADLYGAGFEFIYFDGSEGATPPFDVNIALAQWRVYKKLENAPVFCEGAARSHFSWHILNGGNAFDIWQPKVFKEMIAKYPFAEAPHMANDFTRINFGWWGMQADQRADIIEYGTALAAAWDCPGSFTASIDQLDNHPRTDDILEVIRRWEDARESGFVTEGVKAELRRSEAEHTLLINEDGEYELCEWHEVKNAARGDSSVTVFVLERREKRCAVVWSNTGCGKLFLPLSDDNANYTEEIGGKSLPIARSDDGITLEIGRKRFLITDATEEAVVKAFEDAELK